MAKPSRKAAAPRPPPVRRRSVALILAALVVAGGSVGGYAWWRTEQRAAVVAEALPPLPDLSTWLPELRHRIESTYRRAREAERPVEALGELSRLLHANGFLAEAAQCYEALLQLEPEEPRWPHRLASIYAGYGQADAALELWRRVVDLAPDYLPARLRLADLLLKTEATEEAAQVYQQVLKREPAEPHAQLGLARIDFEAERWTAARDRLERLVAQTNYQLGYDLIVAVYERLGQTQKAETVRGQMLASGAYRDPVDPWLEELWDDSYDLYQLSLTAGTAERVGDTTTAVRRLERALRLDPENHSIHFQLGLTYQKMKEPAKARQHLERATQLVPTFSDAWAHLSSLHAVAGDAASAQRVLQEGLRHSPDSFGLRLMRARQLKEAGRVQEAIRDYHLALEQRPNAVEAHIELAMTYFRIDAVEEGVAALQQALIAEPENPTALTTLALHAINSGNEAAARQWIQRSSDQPRVRREIMLSLQQRYRERFSQPAPSD